MKILSVEQIRAADAFTISNEPISSIDLMERAARACYDWIISNYNSNTVFKIICGLGNNGGDGLAIARMLAEQNFKTDVFIINTSANRSADFLINYNRLKEIKKDNCSIHEIDSEELFRSAFFPLSDNVVLIDALLGSGLNRPVEGLVAMVIDAINSAVAPVVAIDVPSGLFCDKLNAPDDSIVNATYTLSFQFPKLSFMFPENAIHVGEFHIIDIQLSQQYIAEMHTKKYFIAEEIARQLLHKRTSNAHKGNFGHALIMAGSYGKMGAAVLSAKACMHAGVGLLTVHVPHAGYDIIQTTVPEAMVVADDNAKHLSVNIKVETYDAIGVGPGIGTEEDTQRVLKVLIQNTKVPLVIDADAINILSENKTWISFVPPNSIFTPHPKEFERLVGKCLNSEERLDKQKMFSLKYNVYVVLKGAHTSISTPDGSLYFNSTGNPGMATAGSGDVLTGIITALMAQGYSPLKSALLGVYLHGLSGDFAANSLSQESMVASDIITSLASAFRFLHQS